MNLENTKPKKQPKTKDHIKRILMWLAGIFFISITLLYLNNLFFWLTDQQNFIPIYTFEVFNKTLLFSLSVLTILLLYLNYELQKDELNKLNTANQELVDVNEKLVLSNYNMVDANYSMLEENRKANTELVKSNQLLLFNNQMNYLSSTIEKSNFLKYYNGTDEKSPYGYFEDEIKRNRLLLELKIINNTLEYCNENLKLIEGKEKIYFIRIPFNFDEIKTFVYKSKSDFQESQSEILEVTFNNIIKNLKMSTTSGN